MGCDELGKGRAELHVDILDSRLGLLHTAKLGGPGNLARLGKHLIHHRGGLEPRVIDQEVDVGKILGRLDQILRMVVVWHGAERQALVDAHSLTLSLRACSNMG
jgi:hypothetical protein